MRKHLLDQERLEFEADKRDEPVLIAADVKDYRPRFGGVIGCGKRLLEIREMSPVGCPGKF